MMKYLFYILLLIFVCNKNYSQNKWEETHNVSGQHSIAIECPDSNNCFILVSTGSNFKYIYKSINKGLDWVLKSSNKNYLTVYDMSCPDTNSVFLSFTKGTIYKSIDDGQQFEIINIDTNDMYQVFNISMRNKDIGIVANLDILVTRNCWKSFEKFDIENINRKYSFASPIFLNDSIIYSLAYVYDISITKTGVYIQSAFLKLNINSKEFELNPITNISALYELIKVNEKLFFSCGKSHSISGGSGHDAIHKSIDGGKSWKRVLDIYYDNKLDNNSPNPFGLQSIAFRDSLTGIAVGQFGKIVYTYDGGETWTYEKDLPPKIKENTPATMIVRYAGSVPIIATFNGDFYRMIEDNLTPKVEDIYSIRGRVWEGTKGQPGIPVALGYRVTMTDENGDYKFTRLAKGSYSVKALNKYFDGPNPDYYYKPFDYTPLQYNIELTHDTTGFDFNAIDLRSFFSVSGNVRDTNGDKISGIKIQIDDSLSTTDTEGNYFFNRIESRKHYVTPITEGYKYTPANYFINITENTDTLNFTASPVTDVREEKQDKEKIVIYPNPVGDYLEINFGAFIPTLKRGIDEYYDIQIFDILGTIVASIYPMTSSHRMNIENLAPGMYFLKIGNRVEKFVKI